MSASPETSSQQDFVSRGLEAAVRIGLVFLLLACCFQIVRPFITPIVWGAIIAVAAYSVVDHGGRGRVRYTLEARVANSIVQYVFCRWSASFSLAPYSVL